MKRLLTLLLSLLFVAGLSVTSYAQEMTEEAVEAEAAPAPVQVMETESEIQTPDAEGVFPSVMHKGDVLEFLKVVGVTAGKNIVPSSQVHGDISVNLFNVTWKEVLDVVLSSNGFAYEEKGNFIYVYTQKELEEKIEAARKTVSRIFKLNYIPASDAVALLTPLLSEAGTTTTSPDATVSDDPVGDEWAGVNCIVVVDYPEYIENIAKAVKEMDKRPAQVLIESTILVASLDDSNELGIDFNVLGGVDFGAVGDGTFAAGMTPLKGTSTNMDLTDGSLQIGIVKGNIGMFITALESITDTVTLGNPKVLTLNRQQGEVRVGSDEGYITTESTATSTTQTVKFLQTGTILKFTPFVMDDGYIRMQLHPENSSGEVRLKGDVALPEKTTTEVSTNVLVKDGQTIVIGGLFREKTTLNRTQVPVVGNIPVLGNLFRSSTDTNLKEEVIFLITPRIVQENHDYALGEETLNRCNTLLVGAREGMMGTARSRIAAAHYNRARELQAIGRMDSAMWHADLATHISPTFLEGVEYRNELRGRELFMPEYTNMRTFMRKMLEMDKAGM